MLQLFTAAIFVSAALLFLVQPLTGKLLLPLLGGSPSVWNTCMVFFQAVLLVGYFYSHVLGKIQRISVQATIHAVVLTVAGATLPIATREGSIIPQSAPSWWLIETLLRTVGLPFFVVATTGPLVQRWFSRTDHAAAKDPYFLYAASNIGSVLGLLVYPFVLEPTLTRAGQSMVWTIGYAILALLLIATAIVTLKRSTNATSLEVPAPQASEPSTTANSPITWSRRAKWVALAFVPSSLMLGVTQHISTDIAAIPLLWIIPLLIYLLSFVSAFSKRARVSPRIMGRVLPFVVLVLLVMLLIGARSPVLIIVAVHLIAFTTVALLGHTRLADDRPGTSGLTEFYLWMSVGGVLGGIFNALLAPSLFSFVIEYPIMLAAACLLTPRATNELADHSAAEPKVRIKRLLLIGAAGAAAALSLFLAETSIMAAWAESVAGDNNPVALRYLSAFLRAGLPVLVGGVVLLGRGSIRFAVVTLILGVGSCFIGLGGHVLLVERTFFGVHRVTTNEKRTWNVLHHGTTLHGLQLRTQGLRPAGSPNPDADFRNKLFYGKPQDLSRDERTPFYYLIPTTYYHPSGPIGDVMAILTNQNRLKEVALIGMGTGSLAAYGRPTSRFTMIEIDPAVVEIARNPEYFSYIADSLGSGELFVGDGRIMIDGINDRKFNLVAIDAFSSDAIPVHLITKEALEIYLSKLTDDGLLAFHISNRYFDLGPVLTRLGQELNLHVYLRNDNVITKEQASEGKKDSTWVVLCRDPEHFQPLSTLPNWKRMEPDSRYPLWTDDYSNVLEVFVGW